MRGNSGLADMEKTFSGADGLFFPEAGKPGLDIEDMHPSERPQALRKILGEIETHYRAGSSDAIGYINYDYAGIESCRTIRTTEGGGWACMERVYDKFRGSEPGAACIVAWKDLRGRGGKPIRYALVFLDNKSPSRSRAEEIDLDVAVLTPNGEGCNVSFNESKRLYPGPDDGRLSLIADAARISRHIMSEMPRHFGRTGLEFRARDLYRSAVSYLKSRFRVFPLSFQD